MMEKKKYKTNLLKLAAYILSLIALLTTVVYLLVSFSNNEDEYFYQSNWSEMTFNEHMNEFKDNETDRYEIVDMFIKYHPRADIVIDKVNDGFNLTYISSENNINISNNVSNQIIYAPYTTINIVEEITIDNSIIVSKDLNVVSETITNNSIILNTNIYSALSLNKTICFISKPTTNFKIKYSQSILVFDWISYLNRPNIRGYELNNNTYIDIKE